MTTRINCSGVGTAIAFTSLQATVLHAIRVNPAFVCFLLWEITMHFLPAGQIWPGQTAAAPLARSFGEDASASASIAFELPGSVSSSTASSREAGEGTSTQLTSDVAAQLLAIQAQQSADEADSPSASTNSLDRLSLERLPPDAFNYDAQRAKAADGLRRTMRDLGIPPGTKVEITFTPEGRIHVAADTPRAAELEDAVNADRELRNAIAGTNMSAELQRLAAISVKAQAAIAADPAHADAINTWLVATAQSQASMPSVLTFDGGTVEAWFIGGDGRRLGIHDALPEPPTFA
jgi:hypothetical protein